MSCPIGSSCIANFYLSELRHIFECPRITFRAQGCIKVFIINIGSYIALIIRNDGSLEGSVYIYDIYIRAYN